MKNKKTDQPPKEPLLKFFEGQRSPLSVLHPKRNEENEFMYRSMIQNNPQPILIFDYETLQILEVNRAAILKYGYSEEEFLTLTIKDIRPPEEVPKLLQQIDNITQTFDSNGVWKHRKKNGEVLFVEIAANTINFKNRKARYVSVNDITARLITESQLRREAERSSWLLEMYNNASTLTDNDLYYRVLDIIVKITNSRFGFYHELSDNQDEVVFSTSNLDGLIDFTISRGNPCPLNSTGRWATCANTKQAVIDNNYTDIDDQLALKIGKRTLGRLLSVPLIWENKVRFILAVGNKNYDYETSDADQIQPIANELFKIFDKRKVESSLRKSEEKYRNIFENVQDVYSERKKTELALQQNEKKYRSLFETMMQGIIYQDYKGVITSVNPSALKILGNQVEQMIGHSSDDLNLKAIYEDGSPFLAEHLPAKVALRTGLKTNAVMGVFNRLQNKYSWIKVIAIPEFRPGEDKPYQVFTTFEDITLLKETLKELNNVNRNLEERIDQRNRETVKLSKLQQAILNNAGLAIISISTDGIIRLFNNAAEQMLGYSANEVIGKFSPVKFHCSDELIKKAKELMPLNTEDLKDESIIFSSILNGSVSNTSEWTYIRKDGTSFPVRLTLSSIEDELGKVTGYIGIAMDITQERLANQSKRESDERFHNMFHNHAAVMMLVNPITGEVVDANQAARKFYGYDFIGTDCINISMINTLSHEQIENEMNSAMVRNRNYFQFKHRLSTGEIRIVEVHSTPIDVKGEKLLFSIIHDITERREAEEALKNSEKHLNQITDSVPIFISLTNNNLEYVFVNSAYQDFFNLKKPEIIGKKVEGLLSPDAYSLASPYLKLALEGHTCKFENKIKNYAGKKRTVHTTYLPYYQDNLIVGVLATIVDITDRVKADRQLRRSEAENRAILQAVPDFLFRLDRNGIFLTSFTGNPDALYARPEFFLGKKIEDVLPHDVAAMAVNSLAKSFETHETVSFEYELAVNGQLRYFEDRMLAISDNEALSIIRDITDRKLAEIGLQTTMKKLTILLQNLRAGTLFEDETRHITLVNQSFCDLFKITSTPEQLVGLDSNGANEEVKHLMRDPDSFIERISEILSNGEIVVNDELFLQDGSVFERDYVPICQENKLLGHLWNYRDITDRKAMEHALRESEERWNFALEGSGDGVWDWNAQTNEVFFSHQWKSMFGYSDHEIGNTLDEWDKRVHPDDKEKCYADLDRHFRCETELYINEHRVLCKDGTFKWILDRGKVVTSQFDGKPLRVIGTHTDISKRKKLEETLLATVDREKELNDLKSRFVSMASHEFRTPLATILITDEALLAYWKRMDQEQIDSRLQIIKDQVVHLTNVVTDVMQVAKIQEGKISIDLKEIDFLSLCNETISNFNFNSPKNERIQFISVFKELKMRLDNRIIVQILNNLISNAIKYSVENPIVVVELFDMENEIVLGVEDKGIGISEEDQKHIFQPFYRASNVEKISGNGLGLNIVRESVRLHGGEITFKSSLGIGTTFFIHLPKTLVVSIKT